MLHNHCISWVQAFSQMLICHEEIKNLAEALASGGQIIAIVCAGGALWFWYRRGTHHPGMTINLTGSRGKSIASEYEYLNVMLTLSNPWQVSLALEAIELRLTRIGPETESTADDHDANTSQSESRHQIYLRRCKLDDYNVVWENGKKGVPINLARGDSTQLGHVFDRIEGEASYLVEAIVFAANQNKTRPVPSDQTMQWRASIGFPPLSANEQTVEPQCSKQPIGNG